MAHCRRVIDAVSPGRNTGRERRLTVSRVEVGIQSTEYLSDSGGVYRSSAPIEVGEIASDGGAKYKEVDRRPSGA